MEEREETHPSGVEEEDLPEEEEEGEARQLQEEATHPQEDNLTPRHKPSRTLPTEKY